MSRVMKFLSCRLWGDGMTLISCLATWVLLDSPRHKGSGFHRIGEKRMTCQTLLCPTLQQLNVIDTFELSRSLSTDRQLETLPIGKNLICK